MSEVFAVDNLEALTTDSENYRKHVLLTLTAFLGIFKRPYRDAHVGCGRTRVSQRSEAKHCTEAVKGFKVQNAGLPSGSLKTIMNCHFNMLLYLF